MVDLNSNFKPSISKFVIEEYFHNFSMSHLPGTFERNNVTGQWRWTWKEEAWQPALPKAPGPADHHARPAAAAAASFGGKGDHRQDKDKGLELAEKMVAEEMDREKLKAQMEEGARWAQELDDDEKKRKQQSDEEEKAALAMTKAKATPPPPPPPP